MNDLVKRLRKAERSEGKWGTSLSGEAADEIERLEAKLRFYKNIHEKGAQQAVIDDVREFAKAEGTTRGIFTRQLLDAYKEDRGIE